MYHLFCNGLVHFIFYGVFDQCSHAISADNLLSMILILPHH